MDDIIEEQINSIGAQIDTIESINKALISSVLGEECLTQKDAYSFVYLLDDKIKDLKIRQNKLIEDLKI